MSCFPPKGSLSQPSKKREGWLCEVVGVLCNHFSNLSILLQGMKGNLFG